MSNKCLIFYYQHTFLWLLHPSPNWSLLQKMGNAANTCMTEPLQTDQILSLGGGERGKKKKKKITESRWKPLRHKDPFSPCNETNMQSRDPDDNPSVFLHVTPNTTHHVPLVRGSDTSHSGLCFLHVCLFLACPAAVQSQHSVPWLFRGRSKSRDNGKLLARSPSPL